MMQSSSNELSTLASDSAKYKQTKLDKHTLITELLLSQRLGLRVCHQPDINLDGFDPNLERLTCLARVKSCDTMKQFLWFGLVSLFNGISTFVGYLMP